MTTKLSAKGQIVIPASIRKKYSLRAGSTIEILDFGNEIVIVPLPDDPIEAARRRPHGRASLERLMKETRVEEESSERGKIRTLNEEER